MKGKNQHGLSRSIPDPVERIVRQNSYFGCVICGAGICTIDHVDPEWKDAKTHDPNCMTLLCGSCHDKKTRGIIGIDTIKEAMKNPYCLNNNMPSDLLDFGSSLPKIQFGNSLFINPKSLITIDGISILSILPPDNIKRRYLLNAIFQNINREVIFYIKNNVWHGNTSNWDIQTVGKKILIRSQKGAIVLELENIPNDRLIVHKVNMYYKGYDINADKNGVSIMTPSNRELFVLKDGSEITGDVALYIENEKIHLSNLFMDNANFKLSNGSIKNSTIITDGIHLG